ncbi:MAG: hypothetical protein ACOCRK_11810 [bacterium]
MFLPAFKGEKKKLFDDFVNLIIRYKDEVKDFDDFYYSFINKGERIIRLIDDDLEIDKKLNEIEKEDYLLDRIYHFNPRSFRLFFQYLNDFHNKKVVEEKYLQNENRNDFIQKYHFFYDEIITHDRHPDISKKQFMKLLEEFLYLLHDGQFDD